ncbi:MAG: lipid IV(A) 3-deoxy-D-manno-octulosonic acid transferase [Xanthomonadaceae bacterium]|jgi:3-deoxy-D-manno-octulosonic-acid transferase|nr:lipid IV(A) 3-deoxy-D-manno-octulosonic acid transferase [Xanthomonadaceae bacterium]
MRKDLSERILRIAYSLVLYILSPATIYHLIRRGFRVREYFQRWGERYATYSPARARPCVWLHAVSVGEVNAATPLVNELRRQRPDIRWVITTITPTGSDRVRAIWGDQVEHVYLPYDLPGGVRRFLRHFHPELALIMETELWPNLLFGCRDQGIPVYIINARLSERSLGRYRLVKALIGHVLRTVKYVAAQSGDDAQRFVALGADPGRVRVFGNLKFDIAIPDGLERFVGDFREALASPRSVWIAASTHEGEEDAVIAIHRRLRKQWPDLLMLWAPRHPERFGKARALAEAAGWRVSTRQQQRWPGEGDDVFVIDTLGELMSFYACARAAFVGGSLQPIGGHNLLEPAEVGTPPVTGPYLRNFAEISQRMREVGALWICQDADEVAKALSELLGQDELREVMREAGHALMVDGRGALKRTLALIACDLPTAAGES